jgi:peptidoglycan hydrolase-like protein with peptidoglycan-binding domain
MVGCFVPDQVSGFFDGTTVNGVMRFQGQNGLAVDGIAGPETLRRLNGVISGDTSATERKEEENKIAQETSAYKMQMEPAPAALDMSMYALEDYTVPRHVMVRL